MGIVGSRTAASDEPPVRPTCPQIPPSQSASHRRIEPRTADGPARHPLAASLDKTTQKLGLRETGAQPDTQIIGQRAGMQVRSKVYKLDVRELVAMDLMTHPSLLG